MIDSQAARCRRAYLHAFGASVTSTAGTTVRPEAHNGQPTAPLLLPLDHAQRAVAQNGTMDHEALALGILDTLGKKKGGFPQI